MHKVLLLLAFIAVVYSQVDCTCNNDTSTCCLLPNGLWGCCPLKDATCCIDHKHCCPNGYKCDVDNGLCTKSVLSMFDSVDIVKINEQIAKKLVNKEKCASGTTCNVVREGIQGKGRCPFENGVCCGNRMTCCPNGYECDIEQLICIKKDLNLHNIGAAKILNVVFEECPNGTCKSTQTCCSSIIDWACCPFEGANCCDDKEHCCPNGFKCDIQRGQCITQDFGSKNIFKIEKMVKIFHSQKKRKDKR